MAVITLDMYQTLAIAVVALLLGSFLENKIPFLRRFCIPSPVAGGLVFAIVLCILHSAGIAEIKYTDTFREICMIFFFTSVGFEANMKALRSGGRALILLIILVVVLIVLQNVLAVGLSGVLDLDPRLGICTGSIPMVGGHGTSAAFGQVLENLGMDGATTICTAAATFGLIAGSLIGGPLGSSLIKRKDLVKTAVPLHESPKPKGEKTAHQVFKNFASAISQLAIAVGIGTVISYLLAGTGLTFPIYIGALISAAVIRNLGEFTGKFKVPMGEINLIGGVSLSLFLGIAMITLEIWRLADLALPLIILLAAQTLLMLLFARFAVFNVMGRNYDAAVITAGTCGFGMGATPNAMANMQSVCKKYVPSAKAFLIIPIVGSLFVDLINSLIITFFINTI